MSSKRFKPFGRAAGRAACAVALAVASPIAISQDPPRLIWHEDRQDESYIEPFVEVDSRVRERFPEVRNRVILWFRPDCDFSAAIHDDLLMWSTTLPADWQLKVIPVAQLGETGLATVHYAGRLAVRNRWADQFNETRYWSSLYARSGGGEVDFRDVRDVAESAIVAGGVDREVLTRALIQPVVRDAALRSMELAAAHAISRVPVISVDGRFSTHPDLVGNNPTNLLRVINSLVSIAIETQQEDEEK